MHQQLPRQVCSRQLKTAVNSGMVNFNAEFMAAISGCNSVVECHLPMVNVVGSSPISRFKIYVVFIALNRI